MKYEKMRKYCESKQVLYPDKNLIEFIEQEAKKEVFDELNNVRITIDGTVKLETFFDYKDIKRKHLGEKH